MSLYLKTESINTVESSLWWWMEQKLKRKIKFYFFRFVLKLFCLQSAEKFIKWEFGYHPIRPSNLDFGSSILLISLNFQEEPTFAKNFRFKKKKSKKIFISHSKKKFQTFLFQNYFLEKNINHTIFNTWKNHSNRSRSKAWRRNKEEEETKSPDLVTRLIQEQWKVKR